MKRTKEIALDLEFCTFCNRPGTPEVMIHLTREMGQDHELTDIICPKCAERYYEEYKSGK